LEVSVSMGTFGLKLFRVNREERKDWKGTKHCKPVKGLKSSSILKWNKEEDEEVVNFYINNSVRLDSSSIGLEYV